MGTWICHLRVAEKLLESLPDLDETAFAFGNLAPDSGVPNHDWTTFDPPKEVTHFLHRGEGENKIRDLEFYRAHLHSQAREDRKEFSYRLGYFVHLLVDRLWTRLLNPGMKLEAAQLFETMGAEAWWTLKEDWYDLDHRFVRGHRESLFWQTIAIQPVPDVILEIAPRVVLETQMTYIKDFYANAKPRHLERTYPHLNEASMARFVNHSAEIILQVWRQLEAGARIAGLHSGLELIDAQCLEPFAAPLGDGIAVARDILNS
jgi:Zinc dependent phospholipase C